MIGSSRRPIVKVEKVTTGATTPGPEHGYKATCRTQGCTWTSGPHVVKVAAEEQARWHRSQHRSGS